jgi:hypothetical protein
MVYPYNSTSNPPIVSYESCLPYRASYSFTSTLTILGIVYPFNYNRWRYLSITVLPYYLLLLPYYLIIIAVLTYYLIIDCLIIPYYYRIITLLLPSALLP